MNIDELPAELKAAGETLLEAWRSRSPGEFSSFAQAIGVEGDALPAEANDSTQPRESTPVQAMPYPQESPRSTRVPPKIDPPEPEYWTDDRIRSAVADAERLAAVSGAVDPAMLVPDEARSRAGSLVLDRLAASFDRRWERSAWSWTLKTERRASVLGALSPIQITELLDKARDVRTDATGDALRRLLRGEPLVEHASLAVSVIAHEWAAVADESLGLATEALRLEMSRKSALKAFDDLLQNGFVGRRTEVAKLHEFVERPRTPGRIATLSVSGIGGAGKSTLLAAALRPLQKRAFEVSIAPMIASMDFDRRCLLAGAELELSFELSRQLGLYFPHLVMPLAQLREEVSKQRARRGELAKNAYDSAQESASRHGSEFDYSAGTLLRKAGVGGRLLVLVLDTFEEWQRDQHQSSGQNYALGRVLSWLYRLQHEWALELNVIISGRAPLPPTPGFDTADQPIELKELNRSESVELLKECGLPSSSAREVAKMAGGMPLSLRLAARYYLQLPPERRTAFVTDANAELDGVDAELRQGVLYKRFLDHVVDDQARKIAHPGLALRRVSTRLIREVLARPCGLGDLDEHAAQDLFAKLAREVWLVEEQWPDLIHRPELRKVMLGAMRKDPAQAARLREVHVAASRWYAQRPDVSQQDLAEALYHRLALAAPERFEQVIGATSLPILQSIAASADDLVEPVRVQLLDRVGRRITAAEALFLPPDRRLEWASRRADELVRQGQPERALSLWGRLGFPNGAGSWYPAALFQARQWDDGQALLEMSYETGSLRYAYLMSLVLEWSQPKLAKRLRERLNGCLAQGGWSSVREQGGLHVLEDAYFAVVLTGRESFQLPDHNAVRKWIEEAQINSTRYLRIKALVPHALDISQPANLRTIWAGAFRPSAPFLDRVLQHLRAAGSNAFAIQDFLRELDQAFGQEIKSAQVLGAWSDKFAQCMGDDSRGVPVDQSNLLLDGFGSDDPEWRIPISTALADCSDSTPGAHSLIKVLEEVLSGIVGDWVPVDLSPKALRSDCERNPKITWKRVVEYVDRAGALSQFMAALQRLGDARLERIAAAYLHWNDLRGPIEQRSPS